MLNAKDLKNTILAHHLKGSQIYPGLSHENSDYDWQLIIKEDKCCIDGTFITLKEKLRKLLQDFNDNELVSLYLPENYFLTIHPLWQELRDNRNYFVTYDRLVKFKAAFAVRLVPNDFSSIIKHYAETLRRGMSLLHLLKTGEYLFEFEQKDLQVLVDIRSGLLSKEEIFVHYNNLSEQIANVDPIKLKSDFNLLDWINKC